MLGQPGSNPDSWTHEGYDYERLLWGRTLLSIWDPTKAVSAAPAASTLARCLIFAHKVLKVVPPYLKIVRSTFLPKFGAGRYEPSGHAERRVTGKEVGLAGPLYSQA
jgi:hypothetical protein